MSPNGTEQLHRGNRAVARRDYAAAAQAFRQLIEAEPDSPEGYIGLAKVLDRQSDHASVVALLEPVHQRFPVPRLLRQLADAFRVLAFRQEAPSPLVERAIWFYQTLVAAKPDPVSLFYLGELLREFKQEHRLALAAYRQSWSLDPGSPSVMASATACAERLAEPEAWAIVADMQATARR